MNVAYRGCIWSNFFNFFFCWTFFLDLNIIVSNFDGCTLNIIYDLCRPLENSSCFVEADLKRLQSLIGDIYVSLGNSSWCVNVCEE